MFQGSMFNAIHIILPNSTMAAAACLVCVVFDYFNVSFQRLTLIFINTVWWEQIAFIL